MAGSIQDQKNGLLIGAIGSQTFNNNGTALTSVGSIGNNSTGFFGLNGQTSYSYDASTVSGVLLFSQKGQNTDGTEAQISQTVGPKGLTVTLTLVPASTNNSAGQN